MTASAFNCCTNYTTHFCTTSQSNATRRKNIDFYLLRCYFDISKYHLASELINIKKWQKITIIVIVILLLAVDLVINYVPGIDGDCTVILVTYLLAVVTFVTVLIHVFKSGVRSDAVLSELKELKEENRELLRKLEEKDGK